jgi:outer membrane protein assembly factor BamB
MPLGAEMKIALALTILAFAISLCHASVEWTFVSQSQINPNVALLQGDLIFSTQKGDVFHLSSDNGAIDWQYGAGAPIYLSPCIVNTSSIAVATSSGNISILSQQGAPTSSFMAGADPIKMACDATRIFLAYSDGVRAYSIQGVQIWNASFAGTPGELSLSGKNLYVTYGGKLHSLILNSGVENFVADAADSYLSRPYEYGDSIYFGSTNMRLYSVSRLGRLRWSFPTSGWVVSTPVAISGTIYFGSTDGNLYGVSESGKEVFRQKAGEGIWAIQALPQSGQGMIAVGTTDGRLSGISTASGQEEWSFSTNGKIDSILQNGDSIIAVYGKKMVSISTSPLCSFISPKSGEVIGNWVESVSGTASSSAPITIVEVRAGSGGFKPASGAEKWSIDVDMSSVPEGEITLECRSTDMRGRKETGQYSSISVIKMQNAPLKRFSISSPTQVEKGANATITVADSYGNDLQNIALTINGQQMNVSSPFMLELSTPGLKHITIEKGGYEKVAYDIRVGGESSPLVPFAAGAVLLLVLAFVASKVFLKKKAAK